MEIVSIDKKESISIGTVILVHDRLDLTRITIESYLFCTNVSYKLLIIDNASNQETKEYLKSLNIDIIHFDENMYPGYAFNYGWQALVSEFPNIEFLHRSDNDIFYRAGWDRYAIETMRAFPDLGQFGCLDLSDYFHFGMRPMHFRESNGCVINAHPYDIGGSFLIRKEVWDQNIRHNESPWSAKCQPEDKLFMQEVLNAGWKTGHTIEPIVYHLGVGYGWLENNPNFVYYKKSFEDRGVENFEKYIYDAKLAKLTVESVLNDEDRKMKVDRFLRHDF